MLGNDQVSSDYLERTAYSHDLAPIPRAIAWFFNNIPDFVVKPRSLDEVSGILKLANRFNVPVTLRGSATWGYGGAIPTEGGILLDMHELRNVVSFDQARGVLTVQSGAIWEDVIKFLEKTSWHIPVYPSSAPSSTVGGFAATGGLGLGSLEYGSLVDNVASARIVLATGEIVTVGAGSDRIKLKQVFGSEGTLCVFGDLTVRLVRRRPSASSFLAYFDILSDAVEVADELARNTTPFSLVLRAFAFLRPRKRAASAQCG